jgi:hypothetical protein
VDLLDASEVGLDSDGATPAFFDFVNDLEGFLLGLTVVDGDVGTFAGETKSDGAAKALPCPSDEGDAVLPDRLGGHGRGHVRKGSTTGARTCVSDSLRGTPRVQGNPILTARD